MHLAQLNLAMAKESLDHPLMKEFVDNLDPINRLAENTPGFIWRMADESGNAVSLSPTGDPLLLPNMSVWDSPESLMRFMLLPDHAIFLKRKREWFHPQSEAHMVLWWIPKGHIPTLEEGMVSLRHLRLNGESRRAFTFRKIYSGSSS